MSTILLDMLNEVKAGSDKNNLYGLIISLCNTAAENSFSSIDERQQFSKALSMLLGYADFKTRKKVARQVKGLDGLPPEVFLYFACDDIEIARPFLDPEFGLSSGDCVHIAKYGSREHRLHLIGHPVLGPRLTREIIRHGEPDIIRKLNEREDIAIYFEYDDTDGAGASADGERDDFYSASEKERLNVLDTMLTTYSEKSRYADLVEIMAKQATIPKQVVRDMFTDNDSEPFMRFCKGMGVGPEAFRKVAQFRCRRLGQLERLAEQAAESFAALDAEECRGFYDATVKRANRIPI